jgi:hypothetical protein
MVCKVTSRIGFRSTAALKLSSMVCAASLTLGQSENTFPPSDSRESPCGRTLKSGRRDSAFSWRAGTTQAGSHTSKQM